jgi:hypothetical protein
LFTSGAIIYAYVNGNPVNHTDRLGLETDVFKPQPYYPGPLDAFIPYSPTNKANANRIYQAFKEFDGGDSGDGDGNGGDDDYDIPGDIPSIPCIYQYSKSIGDDSKICYHLCPGAKSEKDVLTLAVVGCGADCPGIIYPPL